MSTAWSIDAIARELRQAQATRTPCPAPRERRPELTVEEAYAIQRLNIEARSGERLVGYKIGLTSEAIQSWLGIDVPDFGTLTSAMAFADGAAIERTTLLQPRIEAELAFVLERELRGPGITPNDVLRATAFVLPALEVIDSRVADWQIRYVDTVADNASSGLFVCGSQPLSLASLDVRLVGMTMRHNGRIAATGAGAACLGNPLAAVAWLANALGALGTPLEAGHTILSGALGKAVPLEAGDSVEARVGPGTVRVRFV